MTDTSGAPVAPQQPGTTTEGNQPTPPSPNAEAAKYRRRLRNAETERDQLAEKVAEFEAVERETTLTQVRTTHAERIGLPSLAEHLTGDDEDQITVDADRVATIATNVLEGFHHPDTGVLAQAQELLAEHDVTPESGGFTLAGAAQLLHQLPTILQADNPGEELAAVLETARPKQPTGPFVPLPQPGILRQVHGGDVSSGMTMGEAMRGML